MADAGPDDKKKAETTPGQAALSLFGIIVLLVILWFANGGPSKADLRGLFLAPPAPVGPGNAYGPQIGRPNPNISQ